MAAGHIRRRNDPALQFSFEFREPNLTTRQLWPLVVAHALADLVYCFPLLHNS
jgi:hypothetical protein